MAKAGDSQRTRDQSQLAAVLQEHITCALLGVDANAVVGNDSRCRSGNFKFFCDILQNRREGCVFWNINTVSERGQKRYGKGRRKSVPMAFVSTELEERGGKHKDGTVRSPRKHCWLMQVVHAKRKLRVGSQDDFERHFVGSLSHRKYRTREMRQEQQHKNAPLRCTALRIPSETKKRPAVLIAEMFHFK